MLTGIYILHESHFENIYGREQMDEISKYINIKAPFQTAETIKENPKILNDVDVIFSSWGMPVMDKEFLDNAPNLKAVFYSAGSIKSFVTDEFWKRNIIISSAYAANAEPVAEYTLAQILFCLKCGYRMAKSVKDNKNYVAVKDVPGAYKSSVGIISLGMIGKRVCNLLKNFNLNILVYDPFVKEEEASKLGVELCSLEEIFRRSDIVSLHTPWLKETENMIKGKHFKLMKKNSSFINTSRGAVVCEEEMIEVLKKRKDIQAVLDVTYPEPPEKNSPLYTMENVVLTPHIAGSYEKECRRMADYMIEELKRYLDGQPLKWRIDEEKSKILA